jgi:hypothetical protein
VIGQALTDKERFPRLSLQGSNRPQMIPFSIALPDIRNHHLWRGFEP